MLVAGLPGQRITASGARIDSITPRPGRVFSAAFDTAPRLDGPAGFHGIFLERNLSLGRLHARIDAVVRHRQQLRRETERGGKPRRRLRERRAFAQYARARDMAREVAVAELEPGFFAVLAEPFERRKRVAAHAPALFSVNAPRERVRDRVQVGRDVQPVQNDIVAGVADDRELFRRGFVRQALDQLRAAGASRENRELHRGAPPETRSARGSILRSIASFTRPSVPASSSMCGRSAAGTNSSVMNSGYIGRRARNIYPASRVRRSNSTSAGHGASGLMKSGVRGETPPQSLMPARR